MPSHDAHAPVPFGRVRAGALLSLLNLAALAVGCGGGASPQPAAELDAGNGAAVDAPDARPVGNTRPDAAGSIRTKDSGGVPPDAAKVATDASTSALEPEDERDASTTQKKCVVFLHGKSGSGAPTRQENGYTSVAPTGNADGWGGKQWLYFPDTRLTELRQIVSRAISDNACTRVIVHGFSNGGAAAAKLYCRGDSFGGKVVGYVIDDPVPDHGADTCAPAAGIKGRLYWTGGLSPAAGWNCQEADWTCEGGTTVGIQKFASNLKLTTTQSARTTHEPYTNPPEYQSW